MPTTVDRSGSPRAPWILPALLAAIIIVVVVVFVFGSRIKNAMSSPTATPVARTVVVTATPASGTAPTASAAQGTPLAAGAEPTATAASNSGVVTPLPGMTPVPTVVGLQLGMITRPQDYVTSTQSKVDSHTSGYAFYLDPRAVVQNNLPHFGFTQGFTIVAPNPSPTPTPQTGSGGRPVVKFVVQYQGKLYTVFVTQPGSHGPKAIWSIVTILQGRQ